MRGTVAGMPARDTLFVLRPGFDDGDTSFFCPYSAQIMGYLAYFPAVRDTLDVVEVDYAKPRQALIDMIGEANQAAPCLVLGDSSAKHTVAGVSISSNEGHRFVSKTIVILRYLAATRGTPTPH